jgi:hypothetical protein
MIIAVTSNDGKRIEWYSNLLSFFVELIMFLVFLPIFLVLIYTNSCIYFLSFNLGSNFNLITLSQLKQFKSIFFVFLNFFIPKVDIKPC